MNSSDLAVGRLEVYRPEDAAGIGRLMPFLNDRFSDEPMDEDDLRAIIDSPHHDQLVARLDGLIVGTATMNLLMGPGVGREGNLQDFVSDPTLRGRGIGDRVWGLMIEWCESRGINFGFTSNKSRQVAHSFYLSHGAVIKDTTVFHVEVSNPSER